MKHIAKQTKRRAFTLVELLVVIAIIGILFVVLISKVDFATDKAKAAGVQTDFRSYQVAIETVARENAGLSVLVDNDAEGEAKYAELEKALNKNLDPKLHVEIDADGKISTDAKDPWKEQYLGAYLAPDADGTVKDRGAIVMYSKGSNLKLGSQAEIENGVVNVTIESGKATEGADDYSVAVIYTYVNGYGEIQTTSTGFSNNQGDAVVGGNGGSVTPVDPDQGGSDLQLPAENPTATLNDYTWSEIQALAMAELSADEYKSKYGIELGQKKDDIYCLVDFDNYGGFVFMYPSGVSMQMNSTSTSAGGYVSSELAPKVEALYETIDGDLKKTIKEVTIKCYGGRQSSQIYEYTCHLFLASAVEFGYNFTGSAEAIKYASEGQLFEYCTSDTTRNNASNSSLSLWLRTASGDCYFHRAYKGVSSHSIATETQMLAPCFVVGNPNTNVVWENDKWVEKTA